MLFSLCSVVGGKMNPTRPLFTGSVLRGPPRGPITADTPSLQAYTLLQKGVLSIFITLLCVSSSYIFFNRQGDTQCLQTE